MKQQSSISRLLGYAGKFRYLTIASWILSAISALMALMPFVYIWAIIKEVLDVAPDFSSAQNLAHNGWMAVVFAALSLFVYVGALMSSHIAAFRIAANIRMEAMHHIVTLPLGFMDGFGSGKMRKIINESSAATETYLAHQLPDKAGAIATPIGLLALLFFFDWRLGLLSMIPVILAFLIMMRMTGEKMQHRMREYQNALEDMSNEAVEYVRGIPVVKTFGQTVFSFKRFKASIDNYGKWVISYTKQLRMPMLGYTTAINGVFVFLIGAGLYFTQGGVSNQFLINLIFYIIITPVISITLTKIMFSSENAMIVKDALERIDSVLNIQPLKDAEHPVHPKDASVELQNVRFSYDGTHPAVDGVTLKVKQGKTVALVGPSGGGKSTLAALIARFFDVNEGSIRIGGADIRDISKAELMKTVSFVFQDSRLLKASILENVRLARPDASREEVLKALKAAQCADIIEKMPDGVDTIVGTKGVFLSGGEQQRIAIARVMLKNSPVVILDEATAFADPDNESRVQAAFAELSKQKTVIMIAHRLTTVVDADEIFVLKDGKILQSGTHQYLLAEGGLYTEMWNNYQTSVKWKVGKEAVSC
ncbi:ABC transporter ATP-binding protein [Faecalispora anaeroviscerum]|uniref:ABC transporter ATP-binding protein n=1 Tax=Faecalispora anaeroviscerum TaxID=2991836 RepID=UPI0024B8932C|nr:ABC transporter ATP-binding protein [Faecalispora anaeroviscerum]